MGARDHIKTAQRNAALAERVDGGGTEFALLSIAHGVIAVALALGADADPAEQLLEDARRAPVLRMPMRHDTPNTTPAPVDAATEADRTGPTT
jgi:hypothetical protein